MSVVEPPDPRPRVGRGWLRPFAGLKSASANYSARARSALIPARRKEPGNPTGANQHGGTSLATEVPLTVRGERLLDVGVSSGHNLGCDHITDSGLMSDEEEFVVGPDGVPRWGLYGAAGLLLRHVDAAGTVRYLLAERGPYVQHPLTWAYPGGALRWNETPVAGAVREFEEEFGPLPAYTVAEIVVDEPAGASGWFYATVVADVVDQFTPGPPLTGENTGRVCWATPAEMAQLPLHPGVIPMAR